MKRPVLKVQEIPLDDPESNYFFIPHEKYPVVATPNALDVYGEETILECLAVLQKHAKESNGIDYLQSFDDIDIPAALWFIEGEVEGIRGAITALLPEDY